MWNYDDSTPIGSISGRGFALSARNKTHQDCVQKNQKLPQIFLFTFKHKFPETGALLNLSEAFSFIFFRTQIYRTYLYKKKMRKSTEKRGEKSAVFSMLCFCQKAGNTRFVLSCSKGKAERNKSWELRLRGRRPKSPSGTAQCSECVRILRKSPTRNWGSTTNIFFR